MDSEERFIKYDDGTVVIEHPGRVFHLLQIKHMLRMEIATGMSYSRGSVLKVAQQQYGVKSRTKEGALAEIEQLLK